MIPTWGTSTGRNSAGGTPSLLLDFSNQSYLLNGTAFAAFGATPGITFSRGTNATLIDSTGKLTFAPSNMFLNSESFAATSWTKTLSTITSNAIVAPDGTLTADKLVTDSTAASAHSVGVTVTAQGGVNYGYSLYVKAAELTQIALLLPATPFGTVQVIFDLSTVSVIGTTGSPLWSSIVAVGDGWYRVGMGAVATSSGSGFTQVRLAKAGSVTFNGNSVDGLYIWGAQIGAMTYETAPRAYSSTTPKNLLVRTEEFDSGSWSKAANASVTANATNDPNGYLNADKLVEDTATSTHATFQGYSYTATIPYTYSLYIKAAERQYAQITLPSGAFGFLLIAGFDLSGAGATVVSAGATSSITSVGNGWYRCSITATATITTTATNARIQIATSLTTVTASYTGDGTSGIYIWGAQLSDSASLDPYVYNPSSTAVTSTAYYGPRFDYDPVTLAPLGLLIEEARTNLLLNSTTLSTQNITTTAQAYTLSFYGTGTVTLSGTSTAGPLVGTGIFPNRVSLTFTPTAGTLTLTVSGTVSNAQLEAGGFATSYIPTAGASVTRSADIATMVGNNFTNWYNEASGTISTSADTVAPSGTPTAILSFQDAAGSSTNRHQLSLYSNCAATVLSGITQASIGLNTLQTLKAAYGYQDNNFGFSANGGTVALDTLGTVPLSIGYATLGRWDYGVNATINGHIKSISYYNTRLTDAQLQAITL